MCPYVHTFNVLKLTPTVNCSKTLLWNAWYLVHYMANLQCININKISHLYSRYRKLWGYKENAHSQVRTF